MTRTPDEIKKGLECCMGDPLVWHCDECPYADDGAEVDDGCDYNGAQVMQDALALIQQQEKRIVHLEALNQQNLSVITMQERTRARLEERISQLEAERDAAVNAAAECVQVAAMCEKLVRTVRQPDEVTV